MLVLSAPALAQTPADERTKAIDHIKTLRALDAERDVSNGRARWWDRDPNGHRPWDQNQGKPAEMPKPAR
jgi:hypothetical protein